MALSALRNFEEILDDARGEHPACTVDPQLFLRFLSSRVARAGREAHAQAWRTSDLYLACAALAGDTNALRKVRAMCERVSSWAATRANVRADDLAQELFSALIVGTPGRAPALEGYRGSGQLRHWMKSAAIGMAIDLHRQDRSAGGASSLEVEQLHQAIEFSDPVSLQLKDEQRRLVKAAFQQAMTHLSARELNVLRMRYLDGLTDREVAAVYQVHRATVVRWLTYIRTSLHDAARRSLTEKLGVGTTEMSSVLNSLQSQLDLSLERVLHEL